MLVALEGGTGKGSGRSIPRFDLHAGLMACEDLLVRFGGHRAAAGITIDGERLAAFADRFNQVARERLTPEDLVPELRVDAELPVDEITSDLEVLLRHFEPFGIGNPAPTLAVREARVLGAPRLVGQGGLKLWLASRGGPIEALGWSMGDRLGEFGDGNIIDVAFRLERDVYQGQEKLVARLCDIRV
jgi:single-stranded-DNA-specific exonuclease